MEKYLDSCGRSIDYLRISVTDRCNLRCYYCMPASGIDKLSQEEILDYEDIAKVVQIATEFGVSKIRFTGGEPLIRKDFYRLVEDIYKIPSIEDISLTTNGILLAQEAERLKKSGVNRLNISLDTLVPEKFFEITRGGSIKDLFQGVEAAKKYGFSPIKFNVVVVNGMNNDEILDFARLSIEEEVEVRFIELMPLGDASDWKKGYIPINDIKSQCLELGDLIPTKTKKGNGPAQYFKYHHAKGSLGFISPVSEHFCSSCNRIRLTSDGKLKTCLFSNDELDLKGYLKSKEELRKAFVHALKIKPKKHEIFQEETNSKHNAGGGLYCSNRGMSQIGG